VWRRGVCPSIGQRLQARARLADGIEDVQQIPGRTCQAVEPRHHQHIAGLQPLEQLSELGPVAQPVKPDKHDTKFGILAQQRTPIGLTP
jgi:hypothetical protein